jgi:preprotein translocase subunit YajC
VKNLAFPLLLFVLVYVVVIVPQGRRRKQAASLRRDVELGAHVMLTSGLFGTVIEIDDDAVVIEAAEGIRLRYAKAAVLRVIPDAIDDEADETEADADTGHDTHGGTGIAAHDHTDDTIEEDAPRRDVVARPANRFKRSTRSRSTGNDAGSGPVPSS